MQIVIIDNYDSFVYNIARYINEATEQQAIVYRNDAIDYEALEQADAIVLSPGPGIPSEAGDLMKVIELYHKTKAILGICLGHQALGRYFGAQLIQNETPLHGKSTLIQKTKESPLFENISGEFQVARYHSWSIKLTDSKEIRTTAQTSEGEVMAFEHIALPLYGLQFHPESILTPEGRKMINNWTATLAHKKSLQ